MENKTFFFFEVGGGGVLLLLFALVFLYEALWLVNQTRATCSTNENQT